MGREGLFGARYPHGPFHESDWSRTIHQSPLGAPERDSAGEGRDRTSLHHQILAIITQVYVQIYCCVCVQTKKMFKINKSRDFIA